MYICTNKNKMANTINRDKAIRELNICFKKSNSYNEAITIFFESYICEWMRINPSLLPTDPQHKMNYHESGEERILPLQNLISESLLSINHK